MRRNRFARTVGVMVLYRLISVALSLVTIFVVYPYAYREVAKRMGVPNTNVSATSAFSQIRQLSALAQEIGVSKANGISETEIQDMVSQAKADLARLTGDKQ